MKYETLTHPFCNPCHSVLATIAGTFGHCTMFSDFSSSHIFPEIEMTVIFENGSSTAELCGAWLLRRFFLAVGILP